MLDRVQVYARDPSRNPSRDPSRDFLGFPGSARVASSHLLIIR